MDDIERGTLPEESRNASYLGASILKLVPDELIVNTGSVGRETVKDPNTFCRHFPSLSLWLPFKKFPLLRLQWVCAT